jgi:hypothetical protein
MKTPRGDEVTAGPTAMAAAGPGKRGRLPYGSCLVLSVAAAVAASWANGGVCHACDSRGTSSRPTIRLQGGNTGSSFEVVGLGRKDLEPLKLADPKPARWQEFFAVYVISDKLARDKNRPAVFGSYQVEDGVLRFVPRFPLVPGVRYRVVFRPGRMPGHAGGEELRAEFDLPKAKAAATTIVSHVYPTRDKLPENQLKFYLHFSAPMSRGQAYAHIRLLDDKGKPVDLPFLELDEELWDPAGKRFTLFFDPGRIKRGLKPREEVGPALIESKSYTLVIDRQWEDAQGNPLKETLRKRFHVLAPDDQPIDPKHWKIAAPPAGTTLSLTVIFPKPLDHALLQRLLWVTDNAGRNVAGTVQVTDDETRWHLIPKQPWSAGRYDLVVDTALEDLAGNSVGRPFEVDVFRPIQRQVKPATVKQPFQIRAPSGRD